MIPIDPPKGFLSTSVRFLLERPLVAFIAMFFAIVGGLYTAPFDWELGGFPRNPVPVDAIPDLGENQQIVFTRWPGRSPQDVDDQITYPLTVALLGLPGVRTVRSNSMFGFSSIYVIFEEGIETYWSRSRILEKLASLGSGTLPLEVEPELGPDATALGQVYWYTLEGRTPDGVPIGGWDLEELRRIQDWQVRYALLAAKGVSEVASIGGFEREYQVDVDPDLLRGFDLSIEDVARAVRSSNLDVGARTLEVNSVEYVVRGVGFLKSVADIEGAVIEERDGVPILVKHVAHVGAGPASRRGALDKGGVEAVGGVVIIRDGANPLATIQAVREAIGGISMPEKVVVDWREASTESLEAFAAAHGFEAFTAIGTPESASDAESNASPGALNEKAWLRWLRGSEQLEWPKGVMLSKVTIVPFYDRSGLIEETLDTLSSALTEELLLTLMVVGLLVLHIGGALVIGGLLPLAVLLTFVAMRLFGVDANVVALSGIAIAIGTMVDMGIVIAENIISRLEEAAESILNGAQRSLDVIHSATMEVASAVITSVATTVIGFLPVFAMTGAEGKLFTPLAFTKTFALVASLLLAIYLIPPAALLLFGGSPRKVRKLPIGALALIAAGLVCLAYAPVAIGAVLIAFGVWRGALPLLTPTTRRYCGLILTLSMAAFVLTKLASHWQPLGAASSDGDNLAFVAIIVLGLLFAFWVFKLAYPWLLGKALRHKTSFLLAPAGLVLLGGSVWLGFGATFSIIPTVWGGLGGNPDTILASEPWVKATHALPGLGREFMPALDEGSFLYMPTVAPHASIGESLEYLSAEDRAIAAIPEVTSVVGKIGRAETPLDPAPISMVETVINYKSEFVEDDHHHVVLFAWNKGAGEFLRRGSALVPFDSYLASTEQTEESIEGKPFRQWRDHIQSPDDIWNEIVKAAALPGSTSAPKLQPIETRLIMLQSGMRSPLGIRVTGPDLESIESAGIDFERLLKTLPGVNAAAVLAERIQGKPYLEIELDRVKLSRFGIPIQAAQATIEAAIGGRAVTTTIEGRERFPVRLRYPRELRGDPASLSKVLLRGKGMNAPSIPLGQLAELRFVRGPQSIKSENAQLTSYVLFDKQAGWSEVDLVEATAAALNSAIDRGDLVLPVGVSFEFAGTWENQVRAQKTLAVILPGVLLLIFLILVLQFRSATTGLFVFTGVAVAWSGGFILLWLYGQDSFLNLDVFGTNLRELFGVHPVHLSIAVWVGFLALFGIATDDGVVMASFLSQRFADLRETTPNPSIEAIRAAVVDAGQRRIRPCLATTATTLLALLPVLGSSGRGSDILVPMAIPAFGGMALELLTMFLVPVLWCAREEWAHMFRRAPLHAPIGEGPNLADDVS